MSHIKGMLSRCSSRPNKCSKMQLLSSLTTLGSEACHSAAFVGRAHSERNHVRKLRIHFQLRDHMSLLEKLLPGPLLEMMEYGELQELDVVIGTKGASRNP
jgi:hypothetical protein